MSRLRRLARFWPEAVVAAAALAACAPVLATPGMPYNVDVSGFFPLTPEAYEGRFWPLWNERGGMPTLQFLPALLFELPLLLAGRALGWGMDAHIKVRILLGFLLSGLGMLALVRHYLRRHYDEHEVRPWLAAAIALAPALLYMLNPWAVHRVFHYFLWLGYALAPFVVLAFERLAQAPGWRRALALALVTALATTDPHNPPYLAILLVPLGLARLVGAWTRSRREAGRLAAYVALAVGAYVAMGAYWILPYVAAAAGGPAFGPSYVLSDQMLSTLSRNGSFLESLRLLHNYFPRAPLAPEGGVLLSAWTVASFVVPALAFHAPALRPRITVFAYAFVAAVSVVFGMGTGAPWGAVYRWLVFDAPWGEGISWLFRDPYRWGGAQAFAYSVLAAYSLAELTILARRALAGRARLTRTSRAAAVAPSVFALAAAALFVAPGLVGYMGDVFAPVEVPSEYAEANAQLATLPIESQVLWTPRMLGTTTWGGARTLEYFDATSSARAALGPFRPHTSGYFDMLDATARGGGPLAPLLARAGVTHVAFHNDRAPDRDARLPLLLQDAGLVPIGRAGDTPVEEVHEGVVVAGATPASRVSLYGERVLAQAFVAPAHGLSALTFRLQRAGEPGPLEVDLVDARNVTLASRLVVPAADARAATVRFDGVAIEPGAPHTLRLRLPAGGSPDDRYDVGVGRGANESYGVSYTTVDAYTDGALALSDDGGRSWRALAGDLVFELRSATRGFVSLYANPIDAPRLRVATERAVSPMGLDLLATLASLPGGEPLREAPVVHAAAGVDAALGAQGTHWVAPLDASPLEAAVTRLPADAFARPFLATTNADAAEGWARGTPEFVYDQWGWRLVAGARTWELDDGRGLAYTQAPGATLDVPLGQTTAEEGRALLRVHASDRAGALDASGTPTLVGTVDARTEGRAGLRWVDAGPVPEGTRALRLDAASGTHAVNLVGVVATRALDEALDEAAAQLARGRVTLLEEAERLPWLVGKPTDLPGEGRLVRLANASEGALMVPAEGRYEVRLRASGPAPGVLLDGAALGGPRCVDRCDAPVRWLAYDVQAPLARGTHALRIESPAGGAALVDVVALASAGPSPASARVPVEWARLSETRYEARFDGPGTLVLAVPHDAGWIAEVSPGDARIRSVPADGVVNAFRIDAEGPVLVTVRYEPQAYATAGAVATGAALLVVLAALAWRARPVRALRGRAPSRTFPHNLEDLP
jgi:hypothetical protein